MSTSHTTSATNETQNQTQLPISPPGASADLGNLTQLIAGIQGVNPLSYVAPQQPLQLAANAQGASELTGTNPNYGTASSILGSNNPGQFATGTADIQNNSSVNPNQIGEFMNPYTTSVIGSTNNLLNQQFGMQNNAMQANAAATGAFGGDRYGVAQGVLQGQQALDLGNVDANLLNTGWQNALSALFQNAGLGQAAGVSLGNIGNQQGSLNVANAAALGNIGAQQSASNVANTAELAALGAGQQATAQAQAQAPLGLAGVIANLLGSNAYALQTGQTATGNLTGSTSTSTTPSLLSSLLSVAGLFDSGPGGSPSTAANMMSTGAGIAGMIPGL